MANTVPRQDFVNVDNVGLDRSNILPHGQIQLPKDETPGGGTLPPQGFQPGVAHPPATLPPRVDTAHHLSTREKLREKKDHAKDKLKDAFHIRKDSVEPEVHEGAILANSVEQTNDSRLEHDLPQHEKKTTKDLIHDPVNTIKEKVTGQGSHQAAANIAAKEIPHGQEVDLVRAHDRVNRAQTDAERLLAIQDLDKLVKERQDMFVRWTMDRHVTKVRRLPKENFPKKTVADFERWDPVEGKVMDWRGYLAHQLQYYSQQYGGEYIGYGSNPPKPSKESMMPCVERLMIASAPLQEFAMTTRRVYQWQVPSETAKYLAIYLVLWYFNLLLPGALSFFIYLVAERRLHGKTIEDLRQDIKRTEDRNQTAFSISELIEKRGDEHWADELIEKVGPWAMVQLADVANQLEVMRNFYEWRKPYRTGATLCVLAFGVIATAITPLWLLVKVSTLGMGFAFFGLWPIATNFPEYRLLVSPFKRIFWNIPTHAEWSIKALQAKGSRYEQEHPNLIDADVGNYKAHYEHTTGHIEIAPAFIRFVSKRGGNEEFRVLYSQLDRLEKIDRIISKNLPKPEPIKDSGKDLKLVTVAGREFVLTNVDRRDEVFSQIVGFSDTDWQVVW